LFLLSVVSVCYYAYIHIYKVFIFLWSPCVADADIIYLPCDFYISIFFSSPNLSGCRLDVYRTSTHDVA